MPRTKATSSDIFLNCLIGLKVDKDTFDRLDKIRRQGRYRSCAEVVRRIIAGKPLQVFTRDLSVSAPMEEMAKIRTELRSIGVNINQITRHFNQDKEGLHRANYVLQVASLYKKVDERMERLLELIGGLAEKWLQRS